MPYTNGFDPTSGTDGTDGTGGGTRLAGRRPLFTYYAHNKANFLVYTHDCHT